MAKAINYGQLMHKAFAPLMAEVLAQVAREGLPGKHHFFITFDTTHPGVDMAPSLRARYPKEMTIVLQDWFADLAVMKDRFSVTLNFGDVPEPIVVPFEAVKTFVDPRVEFGLRFDAHEDGEGGADERRPTPPADPAAAAQVGRRRGRQPRQVPQALMPDRHRRLPALGGGVNGSVLAGSSTSTPRSPSGPSRREPVEPLDRCGRRRAGA